MSYDDNGIPTDLTYYVTESTASGAGTTEKIYEHTATIQGAIVGVTKNSTMRLINVYQHGTFNLVSGAITQKKGCKVGSLIYAENGSTVNMSGGYVCGATSTSRGAGIELGVQENKGATLKLTGGVIAGNCAPSGGGVYANGAAVTVTGGIISGNSTLDVGLGGGIMAEGGIVTVSGGYITNNRMVKFAIQRARVATVELGLLPIKAPMSPFPMARLLAIILMKPVAAFTLPIKGETILARIRHGSRLREELLPLT